MAILLVILTHTADGWRRALMVFQDVDWMPPLALPRWPTAIANGGAFGVELFFVVSAFTLTVSLTRKPTSWSVYAVRRVLRVGPGYWLAAIGYTIAAGLGPRFLAPNGTSLSDLVLAGGFLSVWSGGASLAVVPGGWSVANEISFYVALPLTLWLIRNSLWRAIGLAALLTMLAQAFAKLVVLQGGFSQAAFFNPVEHAPVFSYGVLGAVWAMQARKTAWPAWIGLVPLLIAIVILPRSPIGMGKLMPQLPFAALCAMTVTAAALKPPKLLVGWLIQRIGTVSYSMYLVHWAVLPVSLGLAERLFPADDAATLAFHFAFTAAATFGISNATYSLIEAPLIRWSHRTRGRRVEQMPVSATRTDRHAPQPAQSEELPPSGLRERVEQL